MIEKILADVERVRLRRRPVGRPFVTVAYAQSLDGSIASEPGRRLALSGAESLRLTHALRAAHDAILVGIGTVLADDPQLTVRLVPGSSPRPVVLDSRLRTPPQSRLLQPHGGLAPLFATTSAADAAADQRLCERGARVLRLPAWANGWVDLNALLGALAEAGVERVMVEGGAKVLTSFLRLGVVDYAVVTVAPRFVGGLPALGALERGTGLRLASWASHRLGDDLAIAGELEGGER